MRSMVEGAIPSTVRGLAPSTAFGGPPPPSLRDVGGLMRTSFISVPQIGAAHALVLADRLGGARHDDAAGLEEIGLVGEAERERGVLLDEQHRDLLVPVDGGEDIEDLAHDERREAE